MDTQTDGQTGRLQFTPENIRFARLLKIQGKTEYFSEFF